MENTRLRILEITLVKTRSERVVARADIHFEGFVLKGFKILRDNNGREYVTPPSYLSSQGWRPLFRTDRVEDWQEIQRRILEEYNKYQMKEAADEL